ncbi:MAG TPA: DUF2063 domain-containing protein [Gammaproteobacteria bacterium]|nr:DUF2063 domain-containing protein [Gammaproteobacteria bacterium]
MSTNTSLPSDKQPEFIRKQYEFAAHIRDPENAPRPDDVESRRMAIYSELFYNNVEGFISGGFPVIRSLYSDQDWHSLVRCFFSSHHCKTPLFLEIAQEFRHYLESERDNPQDPPFLKELAHYEWVETAISIAEEEIDDTNVNLTGNLLDGIPVLSPLAMPLQYQFDVQHIKSDYQPDNPPEQPTCIIVYRDRLDEIGFMEINTVTLRLVQLIAEHPGHTGRQHLQQIAKELNHPKLDVVINGGTETLETLRDKEIIQGSRK